MQHVVHTLCWLEADKCDCFVGSQQIQEQEIQVNDITNNVLLEAYIFQFLAQQESQTTTFITFINNVFEMCEPDPFLHEIYTKWVLQNIPQAYFNQITAPISVADYV